MELNNPVVDEEGGEETLGPNIWSNDEEEDEEEDEAAIIFFLSMLKLCRWICMNTTLKGFLWKMNYEKGLGMPKRERIRFCDRGEERREHVMKHKRRHVKISQLFYATLINRRVFILIVENFDYMCDLSFI